MISSLNLSVLVQVTKIQKEAKYFAFYFFPKTISVYTSSNASNITEHKARWPSEINGLNMNGIYLCTK